MTHQDLIRLGEIAHARGGDKGNHANVGVIAYTREGFEYLLEKLTEQRVHAWFAPLGLSRVERFVMPRLGALNFMLYDSLAGGASGSLRLDTQGKLLSTAILELTLPAPNNIDAMRRLPKSPSNESVDA